MKNKKVASPWKSAFRSGFEKKYIELIIDSYKKISGKKFQQIPWEDTRRNMLCEQMRKNKAKYGITFNISTEAGVYDENYEDNGRIDICCYLNSLEEQYIAFECKRFLKKEIIPSYIRDWYYGEGIKRFEDNIYSGNMNIGGMIAFLEEGDFSKLHSKLTTELPQYTLDNAVLDISSQYSYQYILKTKHGRNGNDGIVLFHILMDFS